VSGARAALRVLSGVTPRARRVLVPGSRIVVGRGADCDVVLPHDAELSSEHFALSWDGRRGVLVDEGSRRGTLVGGTPVEGARDLARGAWIRAGTSDFRFEVEVPHDEASLRTMERDPWNLLVPALQAGRLWGIVDASRGDRPVRLLRTSVDAGRSLYEGIQGDVLETVAPHLIRFDPSSALVARLVGEGADANGAIFFTSDEDDKTLRRHFRRFLVVEAEGVGPRTYFRFYDPAVFVQFWAIATLRQRAELSRDIDEWWVPEGPRTLTRIALDAEPVDE